MLRTYHIAEGKIRESGEGQGSIFVYVNPTEAERKHLTEGLGVDEHTLQSALDPDELARMEFEPNHIALIVKRPKNYSTTDNFLFRVNSLGLFVFVERLIVVLAEEQALFEGRSFQKVTSLQDVVFKILLADIFHFMGHLKVINMCSDQLEQEVNTAMENRHLLNLFTLEKSLVYYLNAISTNGRIIEKLRVNASKIGLTAENLELLDDIAIENSQCYEQAQTYSQVLSSLMDARVSIVSNNLNILIKRLNIIMIALMLPTLWISVFSMNVPIPFQASSSMFWFVVLIAALLAFVVVRMRDAYKR